MDCVFDHIEAASFFEKLFSFISVSSRSTLVTSPMILSAGICSGPATYPSPRIRNIIFSRFFFLPIIR